MTEPTRNDPNVSRILQRMNVGEDTAFESLLPLVYDELRDLADLYMRRERRGHTLQPTALVNEAFLKLRRRHDMNWVGRAHFLAVAAHTMRQVLVSHARARRAQKRGGDRERAQIDADIIPQGGRPAFDGLRGELAAEQPGGHEVDVTEVIDLDRALTRLARKAERQAQVVELLYFGGLTASEASEVLGVTTRTIERDWRAARAWLLHQLSTTDDTPGSR